MQQGSYPIGSRVINVNTDNATGVVTGATCDIPLNALALAIQTFLNLSTPIAVSFGGTGSSTASGARTNLGLGSIATQNSNSVVITGGAVDNTSIGATTQSSGAFTTLSASGAVSGSGFSTYLASPPAIGGTAPNTGAFTNLSSSGTVSGTGFSNYLASPPAIGGTVPAAGAFTNLSSSGTVSGVGFSNYLASPPAIGGTAPGSGSFTTLSATGLITPSSTNGIKGTATNDNAIAGSVGEYSTNTTSGTSLTTATNFNATSISLTAGDWEVWGVINYNPAGGTSITSIQVSISTTSATLGTFEKRQAIQTSFTAGAGQILSTPRVRISISSTTTVFLVGVASFSGSTMTADGFISARRVR